jgi:hypothetical protein
LTSNADDAVGNLYPIARAVPYVSPPACDESSDATFQTIGNYPNYITHRLDYEYFTDIGNDLEPRPERPNPYKADGKTFIFPLVGEERDWLFKEGKMIWRYPYFDTKCTEKLIRRCYSMRDGTLYTTSIIQGKAIGLAGAVWNIQADKELIDTQTGSSEQHGLHNGYVSTGLSDLLVHIMYFEKEWVPVVRPALPAIQTKRITPKPSEPILVGNR